MERFILLPIFLFAFFSISFQSEECFDKKILKDEYLKHVKVCKKEVAEAFNATEDELFGTESPDTVTETTDDTTDQTENGSSSSEEADPEGELYICIIDKYGGLNENKTEIDFDKYKQAFLSRFTNEAKKEKMSKSLYDCKEKDSKMEDDFVECSLEYLENICGKFD